MISVIKFFQFFFITRVLYICQKGKSESRGTQEDRARPRVACAPPWITAFQERERKTHIRFLSRLPDVVRSAELTDTPLRRSVHAWWGKFSRGPVLILASLVLLADPAVNLLADCRQISIRDRNCCSNW